MQTLTVEVKDEFMPSFLSQLREMDDVVVKDKNLEIDPYFYERKEYLHNLRDNIKNGKVAMIDNDIFWDDIDSFTEILINENKA